MFQNEPVFLLRRKPVAEGNDIPLDRWLSYVAFSPMVRAKPPIERQGINPFTKQPTVIRSAPGGAFFEGPKGRCEIEYHAGGLIVRGAIGHAEDIVSRIAAELDAEVQLYDPAKRETGKA
jgi:hypothetical protein